MGIPKFQPGDRVERLGTDFGTLKKGDIGVVNTVEPDSPFFVQVEGDGITWHSVSNLRLADPVVCERSFETTEVEAMVPTGGVPRSTLAYVPPALPPMQQQLADFEEQYAKLDKAGAKGSNPKDAIGASKLPLHLLSPIAKAYQAISLFLGNVKYGAWNYRAEGARASVYMAAAQRHLDKWWNGEEYDLADGTPHLANAMACLTILVEAKYAGKLTDDRPPRMDLNPLYKELEDIMVRIKTQYADKTPYHYTIADSEVQA